DRKQLGCLGAYVGESMDAEDEYILLSQWQDKKAMDFAHQAMQRNQEMSKSFAQLVKIALGKPNVGRFEML
ncbi:MAG: antibiotic biosynthesis monooxygenase family protein, partial [Dehalococcoidia bacterium]